MKILVRALVETNTDGRAMILEELEASPVNGFDGIDIANTSKTYLKGFCVYDIATGLYILWGRTKKEALEKLEQNRLRIEEARKTELYKKRLKEFEEMKKL